MPAYHSQITEYQQIIGNTAIVAIRTEFRGPIPQNLTIETDIIDEALEYFKANIFFRNYEIKSESDRLLIYITLYITECLKKLANCQKKSIALNEMQTLALSKFSVPGEAGFPLNALYAKPKTSAEIDTLRNYLTQVRSETGKRLCEKVYGEGLGTKWWLCFGKRRFMDKSLSGHGQ